MSEYGELVVGDEKAETGGEHKDWREVLRDAERMERMDKVMVVARCCNRHICRDCPLGNWDAPCIEPYALTDDEINEAIQIITKDMGFNESAKADEPMKWISVKDHLPEKEGWYLVAIHQNDGYSSTTDYLTIDQSEEPPRKTWCWHQDSVTHWVEATDPPKEEGVNA